MTTYRNSPRLRTRIAAMVAVLCLWAASVEAFAWLAYAFRAEISAFAQDVLGQEAFHLDPYEVAASDRPNHWRLRPGYDASKEELIAAKEVSGKWLGAEAIRMVEKRTFPARLVINAHGFKGLPVDPAHRCPRILTIGDSVTFGIGPLSYPDFIRRSFKQAGTIVEVINAGVEGYGPMNALYEIDRYIALEPEIVTVYLGWNALFSMNHRIHVLKTPWLMRRIADVVRRVLQTRNGTATQLYLRKPSPNPNSADIRYWAEKPLPFVKDVETLVKKLKQSGVHVYLVTLFGLFSNTGIPTDVALGKGHLPDFTDNPYVLKGVTESYNRQLRELAKRNKIELIDFEVWGQESLQPPVEYFFDSVHFNAAGLEKVGTFIAEQLSEPIAMTNKHCGATK